MQAFAHFSLSAVRAAFYTVTVKDQTDFFHLGLGCKKGAASLASFQLDGTYLSF
jgi:hypothetical protein